MIPFCVKCKQQFRIKENGVLAVGYDGANPHECCEADLAFCPSCGIEVVLGFGSRRVAVGIGESKREIRSAVMRGQRVVMCGGSQ